MEKMQEKEMMVKEMYVAPRVEVTIIESEGSILTASQQNSISAEGDYWGGSWGDDEW